MAQLNNKRFTQFNLKSLRNDKLSTGHSNPNLDNVKSGQNLPTQPQEISKNIKYRPRDVDLSSAISSVSLWNGRLSVKSESPWMSFNKVYSRELERSVTAVEQRVSPSEILDIREFPAARKDDVIRVLSTIRHENFIIALNGFATPESFFCVFEHQPITLEHMVLCSRWPSEIQLASIVAQILEGISYLQSLGLEHCKLSSSGILVGYNGLIKIARLGACSERLQNSYEQEIQALRLVMMELMNKEVKEDGVIGVNDTERWPSDGKAFSFLLETTGTSSIEQLIKHQFLAEPPWNKGYLVGLVSYISFSTRIL